MIQLFSGTPGSGKSLHAVHEIEKDLKFGKNVISTMFVDTDLCFYNCFQRFIFNHFGRRPKKFKPDKRQKHYHFIDNLNLTPEYLYSFAARYHTEGREHQTVLYIDECVSLFSPTVIGDNPKLWNKWNDFFRVHRHLGYDIVLIPQSTKLISRKVVEYCEYEVRHYNKKYQGSFGFFFSLAVGGFFSYSTYWRGVKSKPLDSGFFRYRPIYGAMYNSYVMFGDTLKPYLKEWEQKKIYLSQLCCQLQQLCYLKGVD